MKLPVMSVRGVSKEFGPGVRVLDHVDFEVVKGETLVLIGESGSGKTTLLRMFNGLTHPSSGDVRIHDKPVRIQDPINLRRRVGYVQQDAGLLPHWTVEENVGLVPLLLGWESEQRTSRVHALLNLVHLDPQQFRARYPIELSGGQRQRVAFARALAADPGIVLLDEPFGALDAITRHELQRQFLSLKQRLNKTMVMVTHDVDEALQLGDRIAVLKEGRLLQIGTPVDLLNAPVHDYVVQLLRHRSHGVFS
ncbi:MAG: ATP-binding cassette domain-containing protein [Nitrospira sp. SB0677_bin_15]|nr:ATP-binding cassette domain-containing protein [Nitrospira sp. SB0667_bin_9]MYD30202.1 ATP-binding cassette domain-containing protein [Nitrospira sp. SB0661_bin_20]MYG40427.1 ATP-binding cassette domain-containing protein [Nitrospira sp. SB0677_bin_15]MYH02320.1 ATP-binding cassette domain-containing protein [Nitrospira sp. SB0675_bin_23]MYJ21812.1 ATP-binding cassette domain-containing protein [Nitrospira sp. SB0673_bin_12]